MGGAAKVLLDAKEITDEKKMRKANIDVKKIDKTALFEGAKGTYLDLVFFDNNDGRDQYGNDGFVVQDIGKDRRLAGERGPILGNWIELDVNASRNIPGQDSSPPPQSQPGGAVTRHENAAAIPPPEDDDDIPF